MTIDPYKLLGMTPVEMTQHLTRKDVILYALGVGAAELDYVYERSLKALPTMAAVLAAPTIDWTAFGVDRRRVLHGEQFLELAGPLPVEGLLRSETRCEALIDKGRDKGALAYFSRRLFDESGRLLARTGTGAFLRGDGGFGGRAEGAPKPRAVPDRPPDIAVDLPTASNQAMIYRLSGDLNPLHIDPDAARYAGYERPILHGLATYGVVGRALVAALCDGDPTRLKRMDARFTAPVWPGETIRTEIWRTEAGAAFRASTVGRRAPVLNNGHAELA